MSIFKTARIEQVLLSLFRSFHKEDFCRCFLIALRLKLQTQVRSEAIQFLTLVRRIIPV